MQILLLRNVFAYIFSLVLSAPMHRTFSTYTHRTRNPHTQIHTVKQLAKLFSVEKSFSWPGLAQRQNVSSSIWRFLLLQLFFPFTFFLSPTHSIVTASSCFGSCSSHRILLLRSYEQIYSGCA